MDNIEKVDMPSISKQPILNSSGYGEFGSISNEAPAGLREFDGFERWDFADRFA